MEQSNEKILKAEPDYHTGFLSVEYETENGIMRRLASFQAVAKYMCPDWNGSVVCLSILRHEGEEIEPYHFLISARSFIRDLMESMKLLEDPAAATDTPIFKLFAEACINVISEGRKND